MLIAPLLLIYNYRQKLKLSKIIPGKMNQSFINNNGLIYFSLLSIGIFIVIVINLINKVDKHCVAE